jgi:hypothetical protein
MKVSESTQRPTKQNELSGLLRASHFGRLQLWAVIARKIAVVMHGGTASAPFANDLKWLE